MCGVFTLNSHGLFKIKQHWHGAICSGVISIASFMYLEINYLGVFNLISSGACYGITQNCLIATPHFMAFAGFHTCRCSCRSGEYHGTPLLSFSILYQHKMPLDLSFLWQLFKAGLHSQIFYTFDKNNLF